tara:strand:+ start:427 stop:957 length:531 start_codon:yes stop_codon:yes gene_type:complete
MPKRKEAPVKEESEAVTLEEALAEEGKTVADIGKGNGKSKKEKAPKKEKPEPVRDAEGNVVKGYPGAGTATRAVWDLVDSKVPEGLSRKEMIDACVAAGINKATASTQYALWRKHHIHHGNWADVEKFMDARKAEKDAAKAKVKADEKAQKDAEKAAKKAEKEAKKAEKKEAKAEK